MSMMRDFVRQNRLKRLTRSRGDSGGLLKSLRPPRKTALNQALLQVSASHSRLLGSFFVLAGLVLIMLAALSAVALRPSLPTPPNQILSFSYPSTQATGVSVSQVPRPSNPDYSMYAEGFGSDVSDVVTPTVAPEPTATPKPKMPPPTRIQIPAVGIDAPVVEVGYRIIEIQGIQAIEWEVADYAAGHHSTSANPGEGGNIVIAGHSDYRGEVFRTLERVKLGDEVILTSDAGVFRYRVEEIHYRKEVGVPLEERIATGRFLDPMPEERVTLVTCWPYGIDDHRLIVIAKPAR